MFNTFHMRYAQYLPGKKGLTGYLWEGSFLCQKNGERVSRLSILE
jgi:hypothetical protein